ncbi:Sensor histidine kinase RcsC [bioreactor metagenome]|uniref:histidine kinase n=1 Tax=bioreactor metagenome TaxID=1076179 RepID=A0A644ZI56_9ZZZZ
MNAFKNESLKYCFGFSFFLGVVFCYAALWSLHIGMSAESLLVSSLDPSLWITFALYTIGFVIAYLLRNKAPAASSWILSLGASLSVLVLITTNHDPRYLYCLIIPFLLAIVLLETVESILYIIINLVVVVVASLIHFQNWSFLDQYLFPFALLASIAILLEMIFAQLLSYLAWYHNRYLIALNNEQIIRDNEIKLQALVNSLKDYERYLSETNFSLMQARDDAEQARAVKQNFVQNVSHELRTPLNLIIGFSETMINAPQSYGEVNWTPDLRGDIECIYQNSQHLKSLIDDILDMAKLENKQYEVEIADVDLNSLINEMVLITAGAYNSKGLYLETELSPFIKLVRGDSVRLKQVILNLLSNSLKYTKKGGVKITSEVKGSMACVTVQDTGKGIPKDDLNKVFEAFFQVDKSNNREDYGTGLGLSISKQLIELLGGEISISSEPGHGTAVQFCLPLSKTVKLAINSIKG